jgi:hypothetical protein
MDALRDSPSAVSELRRKGLAAARAGKSPPSLAEERDQCNQSNGDDQAGDRCVQVSVSKECREKHHRQITHG